MNKTEISLKININIPWVLHLHIWVFFEFYSHLKVHNSVCKKQLFVLLFVFPYLIKDADGKVTVTFGTLFSDDRCANIFEALVGTLRAAKKKKVVTYDGELLLQGVHDNVQIKLINEDVWCWDLA